MKNRKLPSTKEWNKIIEEAFSSDITHQFSANYDIKKEAIQRGVFMKNRNYISKWRTVGMTAVAAAIIIAVPVTLSMQQKKSSIEEGNEQISVINTTENETAPEESTEPEGKVLSENLIQTNAYRYCVRFSPDTDDQQYYTIQLDNIPDGYVKSNDPKHNYDTPAGGNITITLMHIPRGTDLVEYQNNITSVEEYTVDDKKVIILNRTTLDFETPDSNNFGRMAYVFYNGTRFASNIYLTDDISEDELRTIVEGIKLVPTDTNELAWEWEDRTVQDDTVYTEREPSAIGRDGLTLYTIGDSFTNSYIDDSLRITVNDAWVQYNFDGITTDAIGQECDYSGYLSDDGQIYDECNWTSIGDTINTIDEVVRTETQHMNVVVVDFTYTNISDTDITYDNSIAGCISNSLFTLVNDTPTDVYTSEDGLRAVDSLFELRDYFGGGHFSFWSPNKSTKNSVDIPVGGSAEVKVAYLVPDSYLGNLYLCMDQQSWMIINENNTQNYPIIDLCDLEVR